jgi:hypothetical protein
MQARRHLIPFLLLALLTLGAALGAGLGLSQGPLTYSARPPVVTAKVAVKQHGAVQPIGTFKHFFENAPRHIPKGYAFCQSTTHTSRLIPLGSAAFKKATLDEGESCSWQAPTG